MKGNEIVDTKYLLKKLTSKRNSVDRSICGDVNVMRVVFETEHNLMCWNRGSCNTADKGIKINSPLIDAVALMFATGKLQFDPLSRAVKSSDQSLG